MAKFQAQKTHCKWGHPFFGENLYIKGDGERVCKACRRTATKKHKKTGLPSKRSVERLFEGLRRGVALRTLTTGVGPGGYLHASERVIAAPMLIRLRRVSPAIDRKIKRLIEKNRPIYNRRNSDAHRVLAAPAILRNHGVDAHTAVMRATASLPDYIRDDVAGSMFLALAEGRLQMSDVSKAVREFVAAHNQQNRHSVMSRWGNLSLDASVNSDEDSAHWINFISDDRRLWA
jgi:hypothetical protein